MNSLVLIDQSGKVLKVYEEKCTEVEIDNLFDDYIRLVEFERKNKASPQVQTLTGFQLENFFQVQLRIYDEEKEYQRKIKEKADRYIKMQLEMKKASVKGWIYRMLIKVFPKKYKSPPTK